LQRSNLPERKLTISSLESAASRLAHASSDSSRNEGSSSASSAMARKSSASRLSLLNGSTMFLHEESFWTVDCAFSLSSQKSFCAIVFSMSAIWASVSSMCK